MDTINLEKTPHHNHSIYWERMVEILEEQFPKGECEERGKAIVMLAYIEMLLNGVEFDKETRPSE